MIRDLQELLAEVIKEYGKNEGYELPAISWTKEIRLASFGEYQYWVNQILISRVLDTEKVSTDAIKSVIYHEYTHQLFRDHNKDFENKMKLFKDYDKYNAELESYFDSLEIPEGEPQIQTSLNYEEETVICKIPYNANSDMPYWEDICYCNHELFGYTLKDVPKEYCARPIKQCIWVVENEGILYAVGVCRNVMFSHAAANEDFTKAGYINVEYQYRFFQKDGTFFYPAGALFAFAPEEEPDELIEDGICWGNAVDNQILHDIMISRPSMLACEGATRS
ncbi:MAG: hypothetical protein LUH14_12010 [Clostridiaceae bacterium]|nr:hypothetical protein [Clostridiaceae bacterium]